MIRYLLPILFVVFGINSYAQINVKSVVIDEKTKEEISNVLILVDNYNHNIVTNSEGEFKFSKQTSNDFTITSKHQGYVAKTIKIDKYYRKRAYQDTIYLTIKLKQNIFVLDDVVINSEQKPDTVFGSEQESVEDFIVEEDKLILLTYEKTLRKGSKIVVEYNNGTRLEHISPDFSKHLFTDFRGDHYLVAESSIYQIVLRNEDIFLSRVEQDYFYNFISRVNDSINQKYYYSNFQDIYPAFTYYSTHAKDSTTNVIHTVEDKFMMELYRSEYKYVSGQEKLWALKKEMKTGIDKEIWIGAKYFTSSLYYKELYAPMIRFDNDLYIFDHYSDYIFKSNTSNDLKMDSVSINYHLVNGKEKWKQPILFDVKAEKVYGLYQRGGLLYLRNINLESGEITQSFRIHYRFVERIKILGDKVYYIYRPFESSQKKFIYSEKI